MRKVTVALLACVTLLASACSDDPASGEEPPPPPGAISGKDRTHSSGRLKVTEVVDGLNVGWDIAFLPSGNALVTERPGRVTLVMSKSGKKVVDIADKKDAKLTEVKMDLPKPWVEAEGGLLGMALNPDFAKTRKFTLCQTTTSADGKHAEDIRLSTWKLAKNEKSATKVKDLITGLPVTDRGQHVGCKPTEGPDGELLIGTGDGWTLTPAQDKTSLGGKLLRVDWNTGEGLPDNPFADSDDENTKRVFSYGHRNMQGVAVRPGTDEIWTVEHGPGYDDEVNLIEPGGNYGYDMTNGGEFTAEDDDAGGMFYADHENSWPMTNKELYPDAVDAKWATGKPTEALSQNVFLEGEHWGELEGWLAVTSLKGSKLFLMKVDEQSKIVEVDVPEELDWAYKRLRAARLGPDGALYLTTAAHENDVLVRVEPAK